MIHNSQSVVDVLERFDTPTISDAVSRLNMSGNLDGRMGSQIRCLFPEMGRMVGHAVTVEIDNLTPHSVKLEDALYKMYEVFEKHEKPIVIVAKDVSSSRGAAALWGGQMSSLAMKIGCIGLVTDGSVRDCQQVADLGFQYFGDKRISWGKRHN